MKMKFKYIIIAILSFLCLLLNSYFLFDIFKYYSLSGKNISKYIYIADENVNVTKYAIYGTHLNIEGTLKLNQTFDNDNFSIKMVYIDDSSNEKEVPITYDMTGDNITFYTSKTINQGIYLDALNENTYSFYIKLTDSVSGLSSYYHLKNKTKYGDLEYYTITRNNKNNKIEVNWTDTTLKLIVAETSLPKNYYDIVIDQGHGGKSTGAIANGYTESLITYDIGKKLQKSLEALGLKVLTTRNDINETVPDYDENGRTVIPNKVKAKYCFSIHINSAPGNDEASGVEIYCPSRAELSLGKAFADNIMEFTNSTTSPNNYGRYSGAIYVLTFNEEVIKECYDEALEDGYEPYNISLDTPLFFMIREVGGISTKAYTDGRNVKVGKNIYYDSNQTAEGYLLELGYISNKEEIEKIVNNKDKYVEAMTKSIKDYLKIE